MNFVHEIDSHGWKTFHRLVCINTESERIEGTWALHEHPAFLSGKELSGENESDMTPSAGYFALTDYYTSGGSMVAAYTAYPDGRVTEVIQFTTHELTQEEHAAAQASDGEANDDEFALKA